MSNDLLIKEVIDIMNDIENKLSTFNDTLSRDSEAAVNKIQEIRYDIELVSEYLRKYKWIGI